MNIGYTISKENQEIMIRVNKDLLTEEQLTQLLDYLTLAQMQKSSKLTPEQAEELAEDIDKIAWESIKHKVLGDV